jgi:hypothetical protein
MDHKPIRRVIIAPLTFTKRVALAPEKEPEEKPEKERAFVLNEGWSNLKDRIREEREKIQEDSDRISAELRKLNLKRYHLFELLEVPFEILDSLNKFDADSVLRLEKFLEERTERFELVKAGIFNRPKNEEPSRKGQNKTKSQLNQKNKKDGA